MDTFYAIVLNKNDTGKEAIWYITKSSSNLEKLRGETTHDDTIRMTLSKLMYRGKQREPISLLNTHFNVIDHGFIYELDHA
jgi:hypothetical protein